MYLKKKITIVVSMNVTDFYRTFSELSQCPRSGQQYIMYNGT